MSYVSSIDAVGIEERNRKLNQLNDEIVQVKNELDERSMNMTDGSKNKLRNYYRRNRVNRGFYRKNLILRVYVPSNISSLLFIKTSFKICLTSYSNLTNQRKQHSHRSGNR